MGGYVTAVCVKAAKLRVFHPNHVKEKLRAAQMAML